LAEATLSGTHRRHTWVAGSALQRDWYRSRDLSTFDFTHFVPAAFVQDEYAVSEHLAVSGSGRVDFDDEHGTFFNPLVAALVRPGGGWSVRLSAGTGYSPRPVHGRDIGRRPLHVLPLRDLKPERARTSSLDVGWSTPGLELNGTLFLSEVSRPLVLSDSSVQPGSFEIANASKPTETWGSELLARFTTGPQQVIVTIPTRTQPRRTRWVPPGASAAHASACR